MELNFSKLDNITSQNPYEQLNNNDYVDTNSDNYWEHAKSKKEQTKRKKVSFNDILSNMNLVVNKKGVLVSMQPAQTIEPEQDYQYEQQYVPQQEQYQDITQKKQYQKVPQQPIDPSVKHSYIYNKYFKDYADVSPQIPELRVPKTIEEYNQMVME